jgi:Fe-S-cluster containining protein
MDCFSFQCSACGKCCNSPPQMSIPELFHHQNLFIGCLAIRRVKRLERGMRIGVEVQSRAADAADVDAFAALADQLLFRLAKPLDRGYDFALLTQGFTYPSLSSCPALGDDNQCTIHFNKHPATCSAVPMDALVPDHLQHVVLASRNHAENYFDAECIVEGEREGFTPVTRRGEVVDEFFRVALAQRRTDLAADKFWWGNTVFSLLRNDLFASPRESARIPAGGGFFFISLVPVLAVLASISKTCRARVLEYIDVQLLLMSALIEQALHRQNADDKPTTQQLRAWSHSYRALHKSLKADATRSNEISSQGCAEAWLTGASIPSELIGGPSVEIVHSTARGSHI